MPLETFDIPYASHNQIFHSQKVEILGLQYKFLRVFIYIISNPDTTIQTVQGHHISPNLYVLSPIPILL